MTGMAEGADRAALTGAIKERAGELGFSLVGVAGADPSGQIPFYKSWIEAGRHGEMAYLARPESIGRRADLKSTLDGVRSVVVVAHEYYAEDPPGIADDPARAVIARYARGADYHDVMKEKLDALLAWIRERTEGDVRGRVYVDTGPILERELASRAGLGWFGRNTLLINPRRGSYFFIGLLLLDIELEPDEPFTEDRCGTCRACLDACPTGALLGRDEAGAPIMDARRCISYLTIELRGPIPLELRPLIGNWVFGCDICQECCPWNLSFAEVAGEGAYSARSELDGPALVELADRLLTMSGKGFQREFAGSPLQRAGRKGLLRNVCVALGNWGAEEAVPALETALSDRSSMVRAHAAWALSEIGTDEVVEFLRERLGSEPDPSALREVRVALSNLESGGG
jgi:epoxyqueuosine reductase